jgi:hypothetical protein
MASAAVIGIIASVASTAVAVYGAVQAGNQRSEAAKYNQALAGQNAKAAQEQGAEAALQSQRQTAQKIGAMQANYGASGVDASTGTPLDVLTDSVRQGTLDQLTLKYDASLRGAGYSNTATLDGMEAGNATTSGYLNAAGAALGGTAQAAGTYNKYYGSGNQT